MYNQQYFDHEESIYSQDEQRNNTETLSSTTQRFVFMGCFENFSCYALRFHIQKQIK